MDHGGERGPEPGRDPDQGVRTVSDRGRIDREQLLKAVTRRHFFRQAGFGLGTIALGSLLRDDFWSPPVRAAGSDPSAGSPLRAPHFPPKATSIICLFL